MVASPCCLRIGADDPWADFPSVCVAVLTACPLYVAAGPCLPPEGTTMTLALAEVLLRLLAEEDEWAAEHVTCHFHHRHRQEEGGIGFLMAAIMAAWMTDQVKDEEEEETATTA